MAIESNRSCFKRPASYKSLNEKDYHMRAYNLSNELGRLEYEKQIASTKIARIESRIEDIQKEMYQINTYFKERCEHILENKSQNQKNKKHVTFEY